jgi:hypothetical protein
MSRAGQRARLDRLLEKIGPKLERIRVEGAASAGELGGPEPPCIIDELTGRRIYVSAATLGMRKAEKAEKDAAKAPASPNSPASPQRPLTHAELVASAKEEAQARAAQAAAKAASKLP